MALSLTLLGVIALGGKEEISSLVLRLTELLNSYGATGQAIFLVVYFWLLSQELFHFPFLPLSVVRFTVF
jgi:hypothetical protein